ncbi:acyl-CoA dehydrogenase family protein [Streptomyces sp. DSM 44915]|uniref:Acyl-CoA dehydrogenase family protein n=1 Tax=Streptomyces chisholmiae TaxID=3075540 RepID=A0ABU2JQV8_9ACTN|nr:acyl-CoA dehydrogenase family protein [Streptomyces sp. DSM 44915]MDT0267365.1 acyl-CoA dehydrogenase family protein [Streptomyces sp. DSM 44915]
MARLTAELRELRAGCRELAGELREIALAVDAEPRDTDRLRANAALELLRVVGTPRRHRAAAVPGWAEPFADSALARVVGNVELARGDVGALNACAAPSLAGLTVDALGDRDQQDYFYGTLARHGCWTFFGMTEPEHGSDATAMRTRLAGDDAGGYRLHGVKRYVANAVRGEIGVVFARTGPTPLAIRAVLLRRGAPGLGGSDLEMLGLRGARLGELTFDGVPVPAEHLLGRRLPASRRGLWGANRAFGVVRLQIAAQALGAGYAMRDEVRALRPGWDGHRPVTARLDAARELLYDLAAASDADPDDRRPPSLAKLHTAALAVEVGRWAESVLPAGALVERPLLEKWCRDVMAFEFMDGTSHMLRLTVAPDAAPRREGSR